MKKSKIQNRPGIGIGFRLEIRSELLLHRGKVDFLKTTADHYLDATARKIEESAVINIGSG